MQIYLYAFAQIELLCCKARVWSNQNKIHIYTHKDKYVSRNVFGLAASISHRPGEALN